MAVNFFDFSNLGGDYRALLSAVNAKINTSCIGMKQTEKGLVARDIGKNVL